MNNNQTQEWNPTFVWKTTIDDVIDDINRPHEDYPVRNDITLRVLQHYIRKFSNNGKIRKDEYGNEYKVKSTVLTIVDIFDMHRDIMSVSGVTDAGDIIYPLSEHELGAFRTHTVKVGNSIPPAPQKLPELIKNVIPIYIQSSERISHPINVDPNTLGGRFSLCLSYDTNDMLVWNHVTSVNNVDKETFLKNLDNMLKNWYIAFENIHPFSDGNGRVGGVVVALLSKIYGDMFLTPERY